jgi:putative aldouronate transport system substrate-binding protein
LKAVLNFFDKVSDEDMQNMLINGPEGRQYTVENGAYKKTTDPKMLAEYGMGDSTQLAVLRDKVKTFGGPLVHLHKSSGVLNDEEQGERASALRNTGIGTKLIT